MRQSLPEADVSKVASVSVGRPTFNLSRVVSWNINLRLPLVPEDSSAKIEEMIHITEGEKKRKEMEIIVFLFEISTISDTRHVCHKEN